MSDSEDSEGEGGLGNVSRVVIRPPGHSGKAKRGHLCFDASFETGNLGRADLVGEFEYDLFLRPDTCNPRHRFWFNFTVDNVKQDQRVIFNVVNISNSQNLFKDGMTPLVKSTSRPKWHRIPPAHVFFYRSPAHANHYVMSFAFAFDRDDEIYQFALASPYSYSRLQAYLTALDSKYGGGREMERSCLTQTLQNRRLDLISVDQVSGRPASMSQTGKTRVIVVMARSHPGESPASFVCQGFLEFLLSGHTIAKTLRDNFVFKVLPMVNPDGVFLGNNRCNLIGQDMNRTWHVATQFSHPTLFAIKNMLAEYDRSETYQLDFVIDIHAHHNLCGAFVYGNTYEDVYRYERHLVFPKLLATNADDFVNGHMMFNADERKAGTARRFCCEKLSGTVNAYSLETSMYGRFHRDTKKIVPYTEDDYMRLGQNLVRTFLEYYRFTNILPVPVLPELHLRRGNRRPRTHRHSRSRTRRDVKARPKTTRCYAPIAYQDLAQYCETSSTECSPQRSYGFHGQQAAFAARLPPVVRDSSHSRLRDLIVTVPVQPYLSIIDFNQLTRGGLDEAIERAARNKLRHNKVPK